MPGKTSRHPEGLFDDVRDTVHKGMTEADLCGSEAFQTGLAYLETGYFWEAHEVLEPVWMACEPNSPARHTAQALIQIANAGLKLRLGRPDAARRILERVDTHLTEAANSGAERSLGLSLESLMDYAGRLTVCNKMHNHNGGKISENIR